MASNIDLSAVVKEIKPVVSALTAFQKAIEGTGGGAGGGGSGGGGGGSGGAGGGLGALTAAIGPAVAAFVSVRSALAAVEAFNPGAIEAMNEAFRSLQATIGYALEPIIQGLTQVFRTLAGEINSVFTDLRPIISELVTQTTAILAPFIQLFGTQLRNMLGVFQSLMPVIKLFGTVLQGVANVLNVLVTIINTVLLSAIEALFKSFGGMDDIIDVVGNAMTTFAKLVMTISVNLLILAGATGTAVKILNNLARNTSNDPGRPAAPTGFGISNVMQDYQKRLVESAKGQGGEAPSKSEKYLDDIRKHAGDILQWLKDNKQVGTGAPAPRGPLASKVVAATWATAKDRNRNRESNRK